MKSIKMLARVINLEISAQELKEVLAEAGAEARVESYTEGTYIFEQNEQARTELYIILEGFVELIISDELGVNKSIDYRYPGDFLGEEAFSSFSERQTYNNFALAVEDVSCFVLTKKSLKLLIKKEHKFVEYLLNSLIDWEDSCYQALLRREDYQGDQQETIKIYPFRKKIFEVMNFPVETCARTTHIWEVAQAMQKRNISSVVVAENDKPVGIITEKEIVHQLIAQKKDFNKVLAEEIMSTEVITVPKNAFFYQALYSMVKHQLKHVVVVEREVIVGIVTIRDLAQTRNTGLVTTVNEIESQRSISELNKARQKVDQVLKALVVEKASTKEICQLITEFNDRLTRRVIELCENEMKQEGYGLAPVDYCFLQMGSAGRKEQFVRTDQDNAIIFADDEEKEEEIREYFRILGEKIVDKLVKCGFEECDGGVMVNNHYWRNSFAEWVEIMEKWLAKLDNIRIRSLSIFLDFRAIYGDLYLAKELKNKLLKYFQKNARITHNIGKYALQNKLPLGLFGRLITKNSEEHKGEINLKLGGCVQMVDCVRAFSLLEGIIKTSTFERLEALAKESIISNDDKDKFINAYEQLLGLRIRDGLNKLELGEEVDNHINPQQLNKEDYRALKDSLGAVDELMKLTGHAFNVFT
ncbi:DUF294 nucleotidyltransferase-like domain-containing protein [Fuchsiella alkaliacetigena]|uniref:DUF294 nucleotidyltransferase-like domain-containing protein n=1 Tax=Fuchsiella alkaliacetigena TaxID=957042 RepID=UPI00200AA287|nr:DUF294 nucleotidyltransferase-like domain-containing protein [Fuchsiella alkaliacetigena]MCK8823791.1 DUF294 nucleotidyltransferase-like domain-containing protein [Fuchsiella alkaliacetigena]